MIPGNGPIEQRLHSDLGLYRSNHLVTDDIILLMGHWAFLSLLEAGAANGLQVSWFWGLFKRLTSGRL